MCQNDLFDIFWTNAQPTKLGSNLIFSVYLKLCFPPDIWMKRLARLQQVCALPSVYNDHAVLMLDGPGISREPFGPSSVCKNCELPRQSVSLTDNLGVLNANRTSSDCVNFHNSPRLGNIPQHELQNAAVLIVVNFIQCIDAAGDIERES